MKKKLLILLFSGMMSAGVVNAAPKQNILSVRDALTDTSAVAPLSFDTDTEALLQNWYLQNYAILDEELEKKNFERFAKYKTIFLIDSALVRFLKSFMYSVQ